MVDVAREGLVAARTELGHLGTDALRADQLRQHAQFAYDLAQRLVENVRPALRRAPDDLDYLVRRVQTLAEAMDHLATHRAAVESTP
jgi:hypothetical protein